MAVSVTGWFMGPWKAKWNVGVVIKHKQLPWRERHKATCGLTRATGLPTKEDTRVEAFGVPAGLGAQHFPFLFSKSTLPSEPFSHLPGVCSIPLAGSVYDSSTALYLQLY